jgi:N-methylhydantoinase B
VNPPWGVDGGHPGTANYFEIERVNGEIVRGGRVTSLQLSQGDIVRIVTGNGGGWGPPGERDISSIEADIANGYPTVDSAMAVRGEGAGE